MMKKYLRLLKTLSQAKFWFLTLAITGMALQANAQLHSETFETTNGWVNAVASTVTVEDVNSNSALKVVGSAATVKIKNNNAITTLPSKMYKLSIKVKISDITGNPTLQWSPKEQKTATTSGYVNYSAQAMTTEFALYEVTLTTTAEHLGIIQQRFVFANVAVDAIIHLDDFIIEEVIPPTTAEILGFENNGLNAWSFDATNDTEGSVIQFADANAPEGTHVAKLTTTLVGVHSNAKLQLKLATRTYSPDSVYRVSVWAKSDAADIIKIQMSGYDADNVVDNKMLATHQLTSEYTEYTFFWAPRNGLWFYNAELKLSTGYQVGDVFIDKIAIEKYAKIPHIANGTFEETEIHAGWLPLIDSENGTVGTLSIDETTGQDDSRSIKAVVTSLTENSTQADVKYNSEKTRINSSANYVVSFYAKSLTGTDTCAYLVMLADSTNTTASDENVSNQIIPGTDWQKFIIPVTSSDSITTLKIQNSFALNAGTYWIDNFTITEDDTYAEPTITSTPVTEAGYGEPYTYNVVGEGYAQAEKFYSFKTDKEAAWLSIDPATGVLSGIPSAIDTYEVTVAYNDGFTKGEQTFTLNVNPTIAITSTPITGGAPDALYEYQVEFTGTGTFSVETDVTAEWLTIDAATGLLSGTPTQEEVIEVTITMTKLSKPIAAETATQTFTLTISHTSQITSTPIDMVYADSVYSYEILTLGDGDFSFETTPTADWLSLNQNILSGTAPSEPLDVEIVITYGTGQVTSTVTQPYTLNVVYWPEITSTEVTESRVDSVYTYNVETRGDATLEFTVEPAANWLTLSNGKLSGTPTEAGTVSVTLTYGDDVQKFDIVTIKTPEIISTVVTEAVVGELYEYSIDTLGVATLDFSTDPAADWLSLTDGVLSGTPTTAETIAVTLTYGEATQEFDIIVAPAPEITSTAITTATVGTLYEYAIDTVGEATLAFTTDITADWLSLTGGVLSGTPTTAETVEVTITYGDDSQVFDLVVSPEAITPEITSTPVTEATVGAQYEYAIDTVGEATLAFTTDVTADWLSLTGGVLSGTPTTAETVEVTITYGDDSQVFDLVVSPEAITPEITSTAVTTAKVDSLYKYQITTTGEGTLAFSTDKTADWLSLDNNGLLSGTPTQVDTIEVTITFGTASQIFTLTVEKGLSVSTNLFAELKVYPNPSTTHFTVANIPNNATVMLMDIIGNVIYQESAQSNEIRVSTSNINNGVYLLQIISNNEKATRKIIVQ